MNRPFTTHQPKRMMVYSHDGMGIGHLRRSLAICECLARKFSGSSFLIATGTPYVPLFTLRHGVDYIKLPALTKRSDGGYEAKSMPLRARQLFKCRRALLLATVQYFRPSIFLMDKTPVGVCREMVPVLQWIRRNSPETTVVFGMRDIEDAPETTIRQWDADGVPDVLEECFDEVWVYGSESVYDVAREYRLSESIQRKLTYTGYLYRQPCDHPLGPDNGKRHVLVTVGGGTDGADLLRTYLADAAACVAAAGGRSTIVGGPDAPAEAVGALRSTALGIPNTTWMDHAPCMSCLIRSADLVVTMGGYNTMCEIASLAKPALVVPRVTPRYEQAIRASLWARLGAIATADPRELTPQRLSAQVLDLLSKRVRPDVSRLDMRGLDRVTQRCTALWNSGKAHEVPVPL